jgi:hypothetical protein
LTCQIGNWRVVIDHLQQFVATFVEKQKFARETANDEDIENAVAGKRGDVVKLKTQN